MKTIPYPVSEKRVMWDSLHSDEIWPAYYLSKLMRSGIITTKELEGKHVLDIGCGASFGRSSKSDYIENSHFIAQLAELYVGCDISGYVLAEARKIISVYPLKEKCALVLADAKELPFADGSFDTVIMIDTLYLLGNDAFSALKECTRVSRGQIIITAFHSDGLDPTIPTIPSQKGKEYGTITQKSWSPIEQIFFTKEQMSLILDELGLNGKIFVLTNHEYDSLRSSEESYPSATVNELIVVKASKRP
jgi:ubiquinone/menaquinone biosynthesis C-methylase UbiE